ncbi:MAG TPA: hypothetical protein VKV73_28575 [Chloroflexota bacterium]|nr:hypothetical protein [Chloroflexota bacterium]
MIRKLLEAFFQHKLLLLLPPILIPAVVVPIAVMTTPPTYETSVSVWIDRPAYLSNKDGTSAWVSAVQTQAGRLSELLRTRAFVADVAGRTSLAPLLNSVAGQARVADLMTRGVTVGSAPTVGATTSEHLLVIKVQAGTAQLSYELCKSIVDAYQEKSAADQADQASVAVDFYQSRLQDAQQTLSKASLDLRRYSAARQTDGTDTAIDPSQSNITAAMLDPKLGAFQSNLQAAQADVNGAQAALNQAQQDAMMSAQGLQYGFQVLDPPELQIAPVNQLKKLIIYPIAAFLAGLGLTGVLLVLLVAGDRSVRSELDLAPGLRVLGLVPALNLKNVPKKLRSGATRRAIGATAGMALPAAGTK